MLTEVKHHDFPRGLPSQYYSSPSTLNYGVSCMVKLTMFAIPFAKPSPNVVPYEPSLVGRLSSSSSSTRMGDLLGSPYASPL